MRIIVPLPSRDFDPTEVAVSWRVLTDAGHQLVFSTPEGESAQADPLMLSGEGLDIWGFVPGLKKIRFLGLLLRARAAARTAYAGLLQDPAFRRPLPYGALDAADYGALLLPGGHRAAGMRAYLEHPGLQNFAAWFFAAGKPVGAICHGVLLAARSISPVTGKSVLYGRKTTALTWQLERAAWSMMRFCGRFWDAGYYRTYVEAKEEPAGYWSVQAEVTRALRDPQDFCDVDKAAPYALRKSSGLFRDNAADSRPAFVVTDGVYVSARWPGDAFLFAKTFAAVIAAAQPPA